MRRRAQCFVFLLLSIALPRMVGARPTVVESLHRVVSSPQQSVAQLTVTRDFLFRASPIQELRLPLPPHATVTGLRLRVGGRWFDARLLPVADARAEFEEAVTHDAHEASTALPPVLVSLDFGGLLLSLPELRNPLRMRVEYLVAAPTCYFNGRLSLAYPLADPNDLQEVAWSTPTIINLGNAPAVDSEMAKDHQDFLQVACHDNASASRVMSWASPEQPEPNQLAARWGVTSSGEQTVGRIEFEVPEHFSALPQKARLLFLLDASYSIEDPGLEGQLALVQGYLSHLVDARVEILLVRRYPERLFGNWVPAKDVRTRLRAREPALTRGNGSHLDRGLALAGVLLREEQGPIRVVAIGDGRMRKAWTLEHSDAVLASLPTDTVMHWVDFLPRRDEPLQVSYGEGDLHQLAHRHGGRGFSIYGDPSSATGIADALLSLVRPTVIDDFHIELAEQRDYLVLSEGVGYRKMVVASGLPQSLRLTGEVWSQPWSQTVQSDAAFSNKVAALALSDRIAGELEASSVLAFALAANAATALTSYLVRDSGRRFLEKDYGLRGSGTGSGST